MRCNCFITVFLLSHLIITTVIVGRVVIVMAVVIAILMSGNRVRELKVRVMLMVKRRRLTVYLIVSLNAETYVQHIKVEIFL